MQKRMRILFFENNSYEIEQWDKSVIEDWDQEWEGDVELRREKIPKTSSWLIII